MEKDLISVIIPAYNAEKFIEKAINSVLEQTYKKVEIIVVNDGSIDNTALCVNKFINEYKNVKLINVSNGGVSKARNIGIDNVNGEFIVFLDADDYLLPDSLGNMYQCIVSSNSDICSTNFCTKTENLPPEREIGKICQWGGAVSGRC